MSQRLCVGQKHGLEPQKMQVKRLKTWKEENKLKQSKGCKTTGKRKHYFLTLNSNLNKNGVQGWLQRIKEIR